MGAVHRGRHLVGSCLMFVFGFLNENTLGGSLSSFLYQLSSFLASLPCGTLPPADSRLHLGVPLYTVTAVPLRRSHTSSSDVRSTSIQLTLGIVVFRAFISLVSSRPGPLRQGAFASTGHSRQAR